MKINFPKKTAALFAVTLIFFASPAHAKDWVGPTLGDQNWSNGNNWFPMGEPTFGDLANISNGETAVINMAGEQASTLILGNASGQSGTLRATNAGNLTVVNDVFVGFQGQGTLRIVNDADIFVANGFVSIGDSVGSVGRAFVDGAGSSLLLVNGADLFVGYLGDGRLEISSGGSVQDIDGFVANQAGSMGRVRLDAGFWTNTGNLNVASFGDGRVEVLNGSILRNVEGFMGFNAGSMARVDVEGASLWEGTGGLSVGISGEGRLNVLTGSTVHYTGFISVGDQMGGIGRTIVDASFLKTDDILYVGYLGDGRLEANNVSSLTSHEGRIGDQAGSEGRVFIQGGSGWTNSGPLFVGQLGRGGLEINTGGFVGNGGFTSVGDQAGSVGRLIVDGTGSGLQNSSILYVGFKGDGRADITNGGTVASSGGEIGSKGGSVGRVDVSGTDSLWFMSGNLWVGGSAVGPGGDGTLRIWNGGTVTSATTTVWGAGSGGPGVLAVGADYHLNTALTFNGGILRFLEDADFINNALLSTLTGPIGVFVDSNDTNSTISGTFTGPGGLVKRDTGSVTLTAANNYTGDTRVNNGTLFVDGSITSNTFVNPNGTLGGIGTIFGNLTNDGVVSPGHSPGTLAVIGNYVQGAGGDFSVEVGGLFSGVTADLLTMSGTASLAGSIHVIRFDNFNPVPGDRVTVLNTNIGRGGSEFDTLVPVGWFGLIQPMVDYPDDNTVDIVFELTDTFASQGITRNQICVGENLDAAVLLVNDNEAAHNLIAILGGIPPEDLPEAFNLIAPEELASIYEISFQHGIMEMGNYRQRMGDIRAGVMGYCELGAAPVMESRPDGKTVMDGKTALPDKTVGPEPCPDQRWGMFATGYGQGINVGHDEFNDVHGYDILTGGFSTGFDALITRNIAIGIGGGYAQSTAYLANDSRVDAETGYVAGYATVFFGGFYLDAAASGGWSTYDTSRFGLDGFEDGATQGTEFNGIIGAGYDWKMNCWTIGPWATFHYSYVEFDGFDEHGTSVAPLHFPDQNQDAERGAIGLKVAYDMTKGNVIFRPEVRAAFQHEFNDTDYAIDWSFRDITDEHICRVFGPNTGQDSALIDAGMSIILGRCHNVSAFAFYSGNIGRDNDTRHGANGGLRLSF